jgi:3-mercaptopyruvate sulfurtransferase SseA
VAQTLLDAGWPDARALVGGLEAWRKAGYPLEPKNNQPSSSNQLSLKDQQENLRNAEGSSS